MRRYSMSAHDLYVRDLFGKYVPADPKVIIAEAKRCVAALLH
jgi:hypothetical protein